MITKNVEQLDTVIDQGDHLAPLANVTLIGGNPIHIDQNTTPEQLDNMIHEFVMMKVIKGHVDMQLLNNLKRGSMLNEAVWTGNIPLVIHLVVTLGANINKPAGGPISTPLGLACYHKDVEMVRCLLNLGATSTFYTKHRISPVGGHQLVRFNFSGINDLHNPLCALVKDFRKKMGYATRYNSDSFLTRPKATIYKRQIIALLMDAGASVAAFKDDPDVAAVMNQRMKMKMLVLCGIYKDKGSSLHAFSCFPKKSWPTQMFVNSVTTEKSLTDSTISVAVESAMNTVYGLFK